MERLQGEARKNKTISLNEIKSKEEKRIETPDDGTEPCIGGRHCSRQSGISSR
jgi:hypothetical protein